MFWLIGLTHTSFFFIIGFIIDIISYWLYIYTYYVIFLGIYLQDVYQ